MCFVWISEQTAIISLYNINWLVFITDTQYVYCAVRTEYLNVTQDNLGLNGWTHITLHTLLFMSQARNETKVTELH